ncbi:MULTISPECIES: preprotein translocase subunit SecG [Eubacterium]|uniref:Protein-export membrane protein SecG n=2 Tax=Eubacterium TaxID=1730 RepID=A0A1H4DI90_9FIRM|nr:MULTISPECIES: preprotein translocase subunit SecG [Eubacterium]MDD4691616.1 preprotein translocase subunit SecG [Eubacterium aggregans]MEA5074542.1 preprotein translocase subunit SecG [Eubacterium aggregans]SDX60016.1 preprotein translocase subunit SecG [Eubacterium barkeri]SEA72150.1 preprotein translocase subunit SecG [Eubacterium aggregans]
MKTFLIVLLIISSFALIISIVLSPAKSAGMGTIEGGAETLFGRKKAKGIYAILEKVTIGSAIVFMISAFIYSLFA